MRVRDMRLEDMEEVELIYKAISGAGQSELFLRRLEALLDDPLNAVTLVAQKGSEPVVGYVLGEVREWEFGAPRAGWIFALGVDPLYQRQGVGQMLLERACLRFGELQVGPVRTLVDPDETAFLSLFERIGFKRTPYVALEREAGEGEP